MMMMMMQWTLEYEEEREIERQRWTTSHVIAADLVQDLHLQMEASGSPEVDRNHQ